jgi:nitrogen-specific signal transduction histidine kinase
MVQISSNPLMVLNKQLEVQVINDAFSKFFNINSDEAIGCRIYELLKEKWNNPRLHVLLEQALKNKESHIDFEVDHEFAHDGKKKLHFSGRRFLLDDKSDELVMLGVNAG